MEHIRLNISKKCMCYLPQSSASPLTIAILVSDPSIHKVIQDNLCFQIFRSPRFHSPHVLNSVIKCTTCVSISLSPVLLVLPHKHHAHPLLPNLLEQTPQCSSGLLSSPPSLKPPRNASFISSANVKTEPAHYPSSKLSQSSHKPHGISKLLILWLQHPLRVDFQAPDKPHLLPFSLWPFKAWHT